MTPLPANVVPFQALEVRRMRNWVAQARRIIEASAVSAEQKRILIEAMVSRMETDVAAVSAAVSAAVEAPCDVPFYD